MGEVLSCMNKDSKTDVNNELELRHSIVVKKDDNIMENMRQTIKDDPLMEIDLYNRLTAFDQKHVMENFSYLTKMEKRFLIQDCNTIDFIKLDFIFYQILKKEWIIKDKLKNIYFDEKIKKKLCPLKIDSFTFQQFANMNHNESNFLKLLEINEYDKTQKNIINKNKEEIEKEKKIIEKGNMLLAQGKCCLFMIINEDFPSLENQLKVLTHYIGKIKILCERLKKEESFYYGDRKNEPVKIFIVSPSEFMFEIKNYLEENNYFSYKQILIVCQNDLPVITKKDGKMLLDSKIKIKKKSLGSGAIFDIMRSYEIFDQEILYNCLHYIQFTTTININCELLDPFCIGNLFENNNVIVNRISFDESLKKKFNYKYKEKILEKFTLNDDDCFLLLDSYVHYSYFFNFDLFYKKYNFAENVKIREYEKMDYLETKITPKNQVVCSFYYEFLDLLHFANKVVLVEYNEDQVQLIEDQINEDKFVGYYFSNQLKQNEGNDL